MECHQEFFRLVRPGRTATPHPRVPFADHIDRVLQFLTAQPEAGDEHGERAYQRIASLMRLAHRRAPSQGEPGQTHQLVSRQEASPREGLTPNQVNALLWQYSPLAMPYETMPSCKSSCKFVRGKTKARERIEDFVLSQNAMLKPNKQGWEYTLTISYRTNGKLDTIIYDIRRKQTL